MLDVMSPILQLGFRNLEGHANPQQSPTKVSVAKLQPGELCEQECNPVGHAHCTERKLKRMDV